MTAEPFGAFVRRITPENADLILAEVERLREAVNTGADDATGEVVYVTLYRCPAHGYIEHVEDEPTWTEHDEFQPSGPPIRRCRMHEGCEDVCYLACDGPFDASIAPSEPRASEDRP